MARRSKKHRKSGGGGGPERFVALYVYELGAPAWDYLSVHARALLVEFRRLYTGSNNGDIAMSVRQAAALLRCHADTAQKALRDLEEKGWICPSVKSGFSWKEREATTWRITNQPIGLGTDTPATKEYMMWRPAVPLKKGEPLNRKKRRTVLNIRTPRPNHSDVASDLRPNYSDENGPDRPNNSYQNTPSNASPRPNNSDTYISTREGAPSGAPADAGQVDRRTPCETASTSGMAGRQHEVAAATTPPHPHQNQTAPAEPSKIGPAANSSQLAGQIDLEDLIARRSGGTGTAMVQEPPLDRIRREGLAKVQREGRGSITRLAAQAGVSRGQMSNFLHGTFGLNRGAMAVVEQYVAEPLPEEPTP